MENIMNDSMDTKILKWSGLAMILAIVVAFSTLLSGPGTPARTILTKAPVAAQAEKSL